MRHHKYLLVKKLPVGEKVIMASDTLDHIIKEMEATPGLTIHTLNDDHGGYDPVELESLSEYNPED